MMRSGFMSCLVALLVAPTCTGEPKPALRPISEAESVLAVYREDWGLGASGPPAVILAAWLDGHVVWSGARLEGGAPYWSGRVEPRKVAALLARFEKDGLFADKKLNRPHFGLDAPFTTLLIKSGKQQVQMQSWHEWWEASPGAVATSHGGESLGGRRRLDVLRQEPADYLFFRMVWSETRAGLADLIPKQGHITAGTPVMKAGVLSWREPGASPPPAGAGGPAK